MHAVEEVAGNAVVIAGARARLGQLRTGMGVLHIRLRE